jgi:hypothetical protein
MFAADFQTEHGNDAVLSGLDAAEIDELREWFCYTKPLGPDIRIAATPASGGSGFCVVAAGMDPKRFDY